MARLFVSKFIGGLIPGGAVVAPKFSFDAPVAHSISLSLRLACLLWQVAIEYIFCAEDETTNNRSSVSTDLVRSITSSDAVGALQVWSDWLESFDDTVQQSSDNKGPLKQLLITLEPAITEMEQRVTEACRFPRLSELSTAEGANISSIHTLLQTSYFIHNIDCLAGWMAQSEALVDSDEHKEVFELLRRETSSIRSLLFQGRVKAKADPALVLISIRDSLLKADTIMSKAVEGSSVSIDSSALRQCMSALKEAVTAAEDVFEVPSTNVLSGNDSVNESGKQIGDIILHADSALWQYLADDSSAVSRLVFPAQSAADVYQVPAWRARCIAIQSTLADWEKAQSQVQTILSQKKAVESELEKRRDELRAALRRCEELSILAAKPESTGRGSKRGVQSKLDDEVKVFFRLI